MIMRQNKSPAGIQYVGEAGISVECKDGVMRFLQFGDRISRAWILTHDNFHCLLLTINDRETVAVKSGFSSGYPGEGPRTFSFVLTLLRFHGAELDEYDVSADILERLDLSALTTADIEGIDNARPIRPIRWPDYISEADRAKPDDLWRDFPLAMPLAIIDTRISDLAMTFSDRPDETLLSGYRRLEDIVRKRTGSKEHGTKLFHQVFFTEPANLRWDGINSGEQKGRASLFTAAYMAHRNPRAHRELKQHKENLLSEFLLLNHLYILEREAA
jgi:hypothetical protein